MLFMKNSKLGEKDFALFEILTRFLRHIRVDRETCRKKGEIREKIGVDITAILILSPSAKLNQNENAKFCT